MKYLYILLVLFCTTQWMYAQSMNDAQRRAILASYSLDKENFVYESPKGEACVNIILNSFRTFGELPPKLNLEGLPLNDQLLCENLMAKLLVFQVNPPSWDDLVKMEEEKLKNWDTRVNRHSKYPSVKTESITEMQTLQPLSGQQDKVTPNLPDDNQISPLRKQKIQERMKSGN
ncbi:MAG: hypothetical protein K1X92_02820 [Bacteroidia bacterium]|nr:hypothetical protein [Bacteroidia bacterium]